MTALERILSKIQLTDSCWIWTGYKSPDGYGRSWFKGQARMVTRVLWELLHGNIPFGMHVLHKCDNPPCVNPDHLFLGTLQDNATDRDNKHRHRALKGSEHPRHKLSESDILNIQILDIPSKNIAKLYGLHRSSVWRIKNNQAWKHLPTLK